MSNYLVSRKSGLPTPSFTVDSGNRSLHAYWLVPKVPADKWKNIQKRIIQLLEDKVPELKVDTSIKNPARVMRCVGGRHSKSNKFCKFKDFNSENYSWEYSTNYFQHYQKRKLILYIRRKIIYF